jgi:ferric-dicitrate binding protein FerR (iron transport regulator)
MITKDKAKEDIAVSQAWNQLYERLEKDGLLPNEVASTGQSGTFLRKLYVAAVLAACLFFGWYLTTTRAPQRAGDTVLHELYNEADATTLATVLEDGTVVYLSEQASLRYPARFAQDKREVILQGDAFFEIKEQSKCPFLIETDLARVEVTGTSFKIKSDQNHLFLLTVREGEVRVTRKNHPQALTVKAGETALCDLEQLRLMQSETGGFNEYFKRILFKDEYLVNVATVINRRSGTLQLVVDPEVDHRITFTYEAQRDITEIARAICLALNLQHTRQDNSIYISKQK